MRAAVYAGPQQGFAIETIPDPTPKAGEVVIAVERAGICGTDLHLTDGVGLMEAPPGSVLGHEYAGVITACGSGVDASVVGKHVTALATPACGDCAPCEQGDLLWCEGDHKIMAMTGAFAEFISVGAVATVPVPEGVSSSLAALAEPLSVAHHAVDLADVRGGERITILGAGPIALGVAYWLRQRGVEDVTVVARSSRRSELASKLGATAFIASAEDAIPVERADTVFEVAGVPGAFGKALELVRPRGTVIGLGFCDEPDPIIPALWVMPELRVQFSMMYSRRDFETSLRELRDRGDLLAQLITKTATLDELPTVFEQLRSANDQGKVLVDPTER